jgi:hypothetical protein
MLKLLLSASALLTGIFASAQTNFLPALRPVPGVDLFSDRAVRTFKIEIIGADLNALERDNRSYVSATIKEGGVTYTNVAVHLKGMGSFRPLNEKPSFAVRFNKYVPDQTYSGLSKFLLNNSSQDSSYLSEYMATSLFRDAGLPSARVTHAFVQLNGRDLGLYVLIEAMNKDFLHEHFRSGRGNLYEAYTQDIDQQLDQDGGRPSTQADRKLLFEATKISDQAQRWTRLHQVLDVDEFISFVALEMFVGHTDGYTLNRNNYRIYHDPFSDHFVFITHGLDWGFAQTGVSIRPPLNSIVVRAVLDTPEGAARYRERVGQLFTNAFNVPALTNRVNDVAAKLKAAARNPAEAKEWENQAAGMRDRIVQRAANIADQLALPEALAVRFDAKGQAEIPAWRPRIDKGKGDAKLAADSINSKSTLHIEAGVAGCIASWRSRLLLPPGKYRVTGLAKTKGVIPRVSEIGAGAGVRISGGKRIGKLIGDTDWTAIDASFDLPAAGEVDIVCELRAEKGEAWFDRTSLRLLKE